MSVSARCRELLATTCQPYCWPSTSCKLPPNLGAPEGGGHGATYPSKCLSERWGAKGKKHTFSVRVKCAHGKPAG